MAPLGEIREALRAESRERRYLQAFRQRHYEFLQRYNGIKQRLKDELDRRKKNLWIRARAEIWSSQDSTPRFPGRFRWSWPASRP